MNSTALSIIDYETIDLVDYLVFGEIKRIEIDYGNDNYRYLKFDYNDLNKKNFEKFNFIIDSVLDKLIKNNVEYVAIENYAYGANTGSAYQIGEFVGCLKRELYNHGFKIRLYEPTTIKMFITGKGNSSKDIVIKSLLQNFHFVDKYFSKFEKYKYDLYDSYAIVRLLKKELDLKNNKNLRMTPLEYKTFTKKHKKDKVTLLDKEFTCK
jgi:Holliday junction resolvasome RuvABC endonuclease subunit